MYTAVVMIEKHLQNQLQRYSAKQDRESVTPEHCTIERYFEKKIVYTSVYRKEKKMTRKHSGAHFHGANEQKE